MLSNSFRGLSGFSGKIVLALTIISMLFSNFIVDKAVFAENTTTDTEDLIVQLYVGQEGYAVDGVERKADVSPFIENGRTFVPVRFVAEAFGLEADWGPRDGLTEWVSLEKEGLEVFLKIGNSDLVVAISDSEYKVTSDVAPQIRGGRTFLPLRAVGEILGAEFDWGPKDGKTEWVEFKVGAEDEKRSEEGEEHLAGEPPFVIVQAQTLDQITNAIADESVDIIELTDDIDIEGSLTVNRSIVIDFNSYTLDGDIVFKHKGIGTSELLSDSESKGASISGDLTIDTPNASFVNNVKVGGTVSVQAVEPNNYTENANGNSITIQANGATITINGNPDDIKITRHAGDIIIYIAEGAEVDIDVHGNVQGVTLVTGKDSKVVLTGDGVDSLKIEGDGEAKKKEKDPPPSGGGGGGTPPPSGGTPPPSGGTGGGTPPSNGGGTGGGTPPSNGGGTGGGTPPSNGGGGNGENSNGENGNGGPEDPDEDEYEVTFVEANSLVGVEIVVDGEDTITTNATGEAVIDLADGLYDFTASLVGYDNYEGDFTVSGVAKQVDFEMVAEIVEHTVTFDEDNDLEDVAIQVYSNVERTETVGSPVITALGGVATKDLEDGNYWFTASLAGYDNYEGDFTVSGVAKQVDFEMVAEVVEHTVTFDEDNNLEDVAIQVYSDAERTETVGNPVTTTDGGVATKELEDGNYWFTASLADHDDYEGDFTVSGVAKQVDFEMVESATLPEGVIPVASRADLEAIGSGEEHTFADGTGHQMTIEGTMDAEYIMVSDINLGGDDFEPIGHGDGPGYTEFNGTFDGDEHVISGLRIDRGGDDYIGLFASNYGGTIKNVQVEGANITGKDYTGILVGWNHNDIEDSYSSGTVSGNNFTGGLVGENSGSVSNCYNTGQVTGSSYYVGGLAGDNYGTISNSYNTGQVTGSAGVGGLAGNNYGTGTISNSYNTGQVTGSSYYVGGLVGGNFGPISNSYSTGKVHGENRTGGLVGWNNDGDISNSYSTGKVHGENCTGGLVGINSGGSISVSHSTGEVTGSMRTGGLVGWNYGGSISVSHSTGEVTGNASDTGGLVGRNDGGDISNSYSTGVVTGNTQRTGGLVGYNNGGTISNSYSTGAVDGHTVTGGLVGENEGTISNSYSTGSVDGNSQVGGLVGTNTGTITNSYWDTEASGQGSSAGGDGRTTDQMQQGTANSEVGGQDMYTGWESPPWSFGGATDYPTLNWE